MLTLGHSTLRYLVSQFLYTKPRSISLLIFHSLAQILSWRTPLLGISPVHMLLNTLNTLVTSQITYLVQTFFWASDPDTHLVTWEFLTVRLDASQDPQASQFPQSCSSCRGKPYLAPILTADAWESPWTPSPSPSAPPDLSHKANPIHSSSALY